MKIIFMGTPDFAAASLMALEKEHDICLVVTQPDTKQGRKQIWTPPAVKIAAESLGIPVEQPENINEDAFIQILKKQGADICIVAAYGQILSREILDISPLGTINIHASLLPRWRGAGPIQRAIIAGDKKTGITIMEMDEGIDTGAMLLQKEVEIVSTDTAGTLHDTLAILGARAILEALKNIADLPREKQENSLATYAHMLDKSTGEIDFSQHASEVDFLVRGVNPWPGAFVYLKDAPDRFKVWSGEAVNLFHEKKAGKILKIDESGIWIACGEGAYLVTEIQRIGGKRMQIGDFLRGSLITETMSFEV